METAVTALASLDAPESAHYLDLILSSLEAAGAAMEKLMTQRGYQYKVDWLRKANEDGRAEGAAALRRVLGSFLERRCVILSEPGRARIQACSEVATLERWVNRAATVSTEDQLFADD